MWYVEWLCDLNYDVSVHHERSAVNIDWTKRSTKMPLRGLWMACVDVLIPLLKRGLYHDCTPNDSLAWVTIVQKCKTKNIWCSQQSDRCLTQKHCKNSPYLRIQILKVSNYTCKLKTQFSVCGCVCSSELNCIWSISNAADYIAQQHLCPTTCATPHSV